MIYLAELNAVDPATGAPRVVRVSDAGFTTRPAETPANAYYPGRISQPGNYRRDIFGDDTVTGGVAKMSGGEIILSNPDGSLDYLRDLALSGRTATMRIGQPGAAYPAGFPAIGTVTMAQPSFAWKQVTIQIRDRQSALDTPLQTNLYAGTNVLPNGLEGVAGDLQGKPKPVLFGGPCYNVPLPCVNTSLLIYQANDGAATCTAAYDRGVPLTRGADYVSQSDMLSTAPAAGTFRCWPTGGYARLGSSPAGRVTWDIIEGTSDADRTVAQLARRIALLAPTLASGDINAADITALDSANSSVVGLWYGPDNSVTCAQALNDLCPSVGAWYGFDRMGQFRIQRLEAPTGTPVAVLTKEDTYSPTSAIPYFGITVPEFAAPSNAAGAGVPTWSVNLAYARNYTVQADSDLGGDKTSPTDPVGGLPRRAWLAQDYRQAVSPNATVRGVWPDSPSLASTTCLVNQTDAQAESARTLAMLEVPRDRINVRSFVNSQMLALIDLGAVVMLQLPRYGYQAGKLMRVIGLQPDYKLRRVDLTLWG